MASKVKEEKVVNGLKFKVIEADVKIGEDKDGKGIFEPAMYEIPADPVAFKAWVAKLVDGPGDKDAKPLTDAYERYCYAHDLKARAAIRPSLNTTISYKNAKGETVKLNLLTIDPAQAARIINRVVERAADLPGAEPEAVYVNARNKLVADGLVKLNADGTITPTAAPVPA